TFSRGVWAPAATIDRIRAELQAERSTESYDRGVVVGDRVVVEGRVQVNHGLVAVVRGRPGLRRGGEGQDQGERGGGTGRRRTHEGNPKEIPPPAPCRGRRARGAPRTARGPLTPLPPARRSGCRRRPGR